MARDRHLVGYLCPSMPDGPMIPPKALTDPCGKDVPVWSDGTLGWASSCGQAPSGNVPIGPESRA